MQVGGGSSWKWKARCAIRLFVFDYYLLCDGKEWISAYNPVYIFTKDRLEILLQLPGIILTLNDMNVPADSTPKTTGPCRRQRWSGRRALWPCTTSRTVKSQRSRCFLCATRVKCGAAQLLQPSVGADGGRWENWRVERTWADTARDKNYRRAFADSNNIVIMPRGWFAGKSEDMKNSHVGAMTWFRERRCCPWCRRPILIPHVGKNLNAQDTKSHPALWLTVTPDLPVKEVQTVLLLIISLVSPRQ